VVILNKKIENVSVDKLEPHPSNPRRGAVESVKESIRVNGFFGTILAQVSTGYILAGNHRFLAAKELGMAKVPVVWIDVDDKAALKILLADNRTSDLATYDDAVLSALLTSVSEDSSLEGTGYDDRFLSKLLERYDLPQEGSDLPPESLVRKPNNDLFGNQAPWSFSGRLSSGHSGSWCLYGRDVRSSADDEIRSRPGSRSVAFENNALIVKKGIYILGELRA